MKETSNRYDTFFCGKKKIPSIFVFIYLFILLLFLGDFFQSYLK